MSVCWIWARMLIHRLNIYFNLLSWDPCLLQRLIILPILKFACSILVREEIKGNDLVKKTALLLAQTKSLNYTGFMEADGLHNGDVDIVVCDGFAGNVSLKSTEGVARFIFGLMKEAFKRNAYTKFLGLLVKPILKSTISRTDPSRYNGATFIGLQGTVIKSHGGANISAFANAIEQAMKQADKNIPQRISHEVERLLKLSP